VLYQNVMLNDDQEREIKRGTNETVVTMNQITGKYVNKEARLGSQQTRQ
jgi:hypothetical protein